MLCGSLLNSVGRWLRRSRLSAWLMAVVTILLVRESPAQVWNCQPTSSGCWSGPFDWSCWTAGRRMALIPYGSYRGQVLLWDSAPDGSSPVEMYVIDMATLNGHGNRPLTSKVPATNAPLSGDLSRAAITFDRDGNIVFAGLAASATTPAVKTYRMVIGGLNYPPLFQAPPNWYGPCEPGIITGIPWHDAGDMSTQHNEPALVTLCKGDIPAAGGLPAIPGSSQLVLGGSASSGVSDGLEFWQPLSPARAVPAGWRHTLVPNTGGVHTPPTPNEPYVRLPVANPPEVRLDSWPRVLQLANVTGESPYLKNVLVAFDMNTTVPTFAASNSAGRSWIVRPPYASSSAPQWEYYQGPLAAVSGTTSPYDRLGGTALLLHGQVGSPQSDGKNRVLAIGGARDLNNGSGSPNWASSSAVHEYRPNQNPADGAWVQKNGPTPGRLWNTAVTLPTGDILILGGARTFLSDLTVTVPEDVPVLYKPGDPGLPDGASVISLTPQPQVPAPQGGMKAYPRLRGSMALLLADGRVFLMGGEPLAGNYPDSRGTGEIFSPPYLACGERPIVLSAPADIAFGASINVEVQHTLTNPVVKFVLIRPSVVANNFSSDNRYIELAFASTGSPGPNQESFTVMAPTDDLGPAGYYMLFVVQTTTTPGGCDVPSVAEFVRLN